VSMSDIYRGVIESLEFDLQRSEQEKMELAAEVERLRELVKDRDAMLDATAQWDEHPDTWDAPCLCSCCREAGR
jgi:hypothetical protein